MSLFGFTTKNHLPTLSLATALALLASSVTPIFAILLGDIFNSFTSFGGGDISGDDLLRKVARHGIALSGLGIASWVLNGAYFSLFIVFGELQLSNARTRIFEELLGRDQEWFETQKDGTNAFLSYLQAQIAELQIATSQPLGLIMQYTFRTIIALGLAFYTSWSLASITLAGIPVFSGVVAFLSSRIKPRIEAQQVELNRASKVANNATSLIDTVKCLNGQVFELRDFALKINSAAAQYLKQAHLNSLQIAVIRFMMFGMFIQGFWYGTALTTSGKLTAGEVLRTFWACLTAAQSIELVLPQVIVMEKGKVAAVMLKDLLNDRRVKKHPEELKGASYPRYCDGDIEVCDLSFTYSSQPERPILNSVRLFFPAGETTFVIGKSGSGKSTLGQLLARFYMPTSGEILIDGNAIQTLSLNWIRNNITLVEQRSVLFNESVLTNIAFGRRAHETVTKEDVRECIDLAMLRDTIDSLPNGLDTCVGPGGSFLSGGQRQRVAIARARLRDTPILIMDEPTSALDGINRIAVMKAIREWRRGKTTIIITHDMSHIMDQDYVYVLEHGSVVQSGYRHELENSPAKEKYFPFSERQISSKNTSKPEVSYVNDEMQEIVDFPNTICASNLDFPKHKETPVLSRRTPSPFKNGQLSDRRMGEMQLSARPSNVVKATSQAEEISIPDGVAIPMCELSMAQSRRSFISANRLRLHRASLTPPVPHAEAMNHSQSIKRPQHARGNTPLSGPHRLSINQIMRTLVPSLTLRQRLLLLLGVIAALVDATATPVFSYCLSQLFQSFYDIKVSSLRWALAVLGVAVIDGTASYFMHYLLEASGQAWVDQLRREAFRRVLDQPRQWFDEEGNSPSRITACLDQNGEDMRNLVGRFGGYVMVAVAITVTAVVWCLVVCWKLTLVALSCGPVIYAITRGFEGTSGLWQGRCNEVTRNASDVLVETFSEIRTVRTLTLEPFFHRKYLMAASKCMKMCLKRAACTGILFGLVESTIIFVSGLIFYYGALLASSGYTVENVMTVFSMLLFSIGYASTVLSWIPQISASQDMATQLLRLANLPVGQSHEHKGDKRPLKAAPVKIRSLTFRYPSRPDAPTLRNVTLAIAENSCTAIVGGSGSGKSTIASLILSLYETPLSRHETPTISIGGLDIRRLHTPSLRSLISIVSQQPTIFPGTIHHNICYGLRDESPLRELHNVRAAAQAAGIDDFIVSLPDGYSTTIGDGGVGLSGGQAQRLVIARALVRRPQVLILDEATSSLDPESAKVIRQTVQRLVSARLGLTVIIITHAREMMEIADNIVVLQQGSIVEQGPYEVLARRRGGKLKALIEDSEGVDS
ncbi:ABC transporter ATP-binding protein [Aspergillus fischeri NRRL 181]|uniref:ABC a-pheromone efflux pump AtrD n=1 Tax=Neosartorya fischeri (strain ATCC 1020 / DSM 3700 / CBS 544.65 / FGSC A1164 / JCM 1740 / NRRL 181 / WB 181) TaxID=331117 RepID=A1CX92_NEOFI|nr:ABC a-pheromone efflux pump AtrD [Aspergillus fischeri NRRL 181]EAW25244.1 ABC a-pheromone efflux pump AtrD [Aspergillus fischeri NRRL 181]